MPISSNPKKRQHPSIDFGFVGDLNTQSINLDLIKKIIDLGLVPVFSAITHDIKGQLYNTYADTIAGVLAQVLSDDYDTELLFCFDKSGVLKNIEDENSCISNITKQEFEQMKEAGQVHKGILPKLENAFQAKQNGVKNVFLLHDEKLLDHITIKHEGTQISI